LDDGLSWPELLTRYEVESVLPPGRDIQFLLLKRSTQPRRYELTPICQTTIAFGSPLQLPGLEEGPIWAEVVVRPTIAGRMLTAAYKPPLIWMETVSPDGQKAKYRLAPDVAKSGFLLSPIVRDSVWFRWLATTPWHDPAWQHLLAGKGVQSIQFLVPDEPWCYDRQISVRLFRLVFPAIGPPAMAFRSDLLGLFQLAASDPRDDRGNPKTRWENLPDGAALTTPQGASLPVPVSARNPYLPLRGPSCRLKIAYGLLCTAAAEVLPTHPFRFRIDTIDSNGWHKTIWSASLDIARRRADAGAATAEISVSLADVKAICFETEGVEAGDCFAPAWFGVRAY
jgi:hypothetical protein